MFKVPLLTFVVVGLSACGTGIDCYGFSGAQSNLQSLPSGSINVSIDGSGSMKGFAAAQNSTYHRVIEELDSILGVTPALNMSDSKTNVSRIGASQGKPVKPFKLGSLMAARRVEVYEPRENSPYPNVSSSIHQFVSKESGSLDILISDLEPDDSSIKQLLTAVMSKLKKNPNKQSWLSGRKQRLVGNQLTLIGIKSQFDGGVFPTVSGTFSSFPYKGLRPFYILVLGPVQQSELLVQRLSSLDLTSEQWQISRFAANPAYGKTIFVDKPRTSVQPKQCFFPSFSISKGGFSGKLQFDDSNKWLIMRKANRCQSTQLQITFGLPEFEGFGPVVTSNKNILNVNNARIADMKLSANQSSVKLESSIVPGSINGIEASVKADQLDRLQWLDWNMDPSSPIGTKTQRLLRLVNSLRSETDLYSTKNFNQRYSPTRLCVAIKS